MVDAEAVTAYAHAYIDQTRDELVQFLSDYIRQKSINPRRALDFEPGGTTECQRWLSSYLSGLGCFESVEEIPAGSDQLNVVASMKSSEPHEFRSLMFNGHSDVVPVTEEHYSEWLGGDPWSGEVRDGSVYGRGASDMKGGNAAIVWAMRSLGAVGVVPPGKVQASFIIGEESGEADLGPENILGHGFSADMFVVAEPSGLTVCPASVGWFFFQLSVTGEAGHAAGRGRSIHPSTEGVVGVNAIDLMRRLMARIAELESQWGLWERHPLMVPGTMAINPVQVSGGAMQATTPDACSAVFAVTLSPNRSCADGMKEIEDVVASVVEGDPWLSAHPPVIRYPFLHTYYDPVNVPLDSPAVLALRDAVSSVTGRTDPIGLMPTPTDANLFAAAGQPAIVCGPGYLVGSGVHGLNEHVKIADVVAAAKSYTATILDYCWQRR
jgi:acetylornithine deacetylase